MISSIISAVWLLAKYSFLIGISVAVVVILFALFHPVRVDLKVRASIIGQRAEFWFWYFFGFLGLGTVASRGNQFFVLQLGTWQWRLWQSQKKSKPPSKPTLKETPPPSRSSAEKTAAKSATATTAAEVATGASEPAPRAQPSGIETPEKLEPSGASSSPGVSSDEPEPAPTTATTAKPGTAIPVSTSASPSSASSSTSSSSSTSPSTSSPSSPSKSYPPPSSTTPTPTIPFTQEHFEQAEAPPRPKPQKAEEPSTSGGFGGKLSRLRRKLAKALSMIRKVFLKGRAIWRRFSPMGKTLVKDLWNSFWILGPQARIRYGFGEPFLVGMTMGVAAQVGGMLMPWGIHLDCVPVFNQETILIRVQGGMKFAPWRAVYGVLRLTTEKDLWRGLYDLYKWYKSRKKAPDPSGETKKSEQ